MSAPTLGVTTSIADSFNYQVPDALSDVVQQLVNLANLFQMKFGQVANGPNSSTIVPTKFHLSTRIITIASSTLDIDLTLLTDIYGNVLNFSKIYRIVLHNNDASGGSGVLVGGAITNPWTAPWNGVAASVSSLRAGADWISGDPYVGMNVTAGSKVLRLKNDASSPTGNTSVTIAIAGG